MANEKKYLAVGPLPPPIGGDSVSFSRLISSEILKKHGIRLHVLDTSRKDKESQIGRRLQFADYVNGVRFASSAFIQLFKVEGILIWANSRFSYTIGLLLILLYKLFNKKVILKLFGTTFIEKYGALPTWYKSVVKFVFRKADHLLPQTKHMCEFFLREFGGNERIVHYPNFLTSEPLQELPNHTPGDVLRCVFVGQVKEQKGVFDILTVLEQTDRIRCDFYGTVFEKDRQAFMEAVERLDHAEYRGTLKPTEVVRTMQDYDILLLPTFYPGEGYPGVIIEAFFAGIPVLSTDWRSIPELVQHGHNGLIVPVASPEAIKHELLHLLDHQETYDCLRKNAFESARQYTEQNVLEKILVPLIRRPKTGKA